jgi:hypothetical protein
MEGPVITVSAGEALWLEGRPILFHTAARVMLPHGCRFIRGRDVVEAEGEDSPELEAYLAVQAAHLATRAEYHRRLAVAQATLTQLRGGQMEVTLALRALTMHRTHHALLALRPLVHHLLVDDEPAALCA